MKEKLERRAALREEKVRQVRSTTSCYLVFFGLQALLQLLLKISDSITRLESFLLISAPSDASSSSSAIKSKEAYGEPIDER